MLQYSIIICTYNRVDLLEETINSVLSRLTNYTRYELLIIDNNSTDNTAQVVSQFQSNPVVRYVRETNQGLSFARNRGIQEAKYPIVTFIDDDIDIDPNYLNTLDQLYADPSIHIVGGKVLPYQTDIPDWLPRKRHYLASVFDLGDKPMLTTKLLGANHSFRKEVAAEVGGYNTVIGPVGNLKIGGDENEFLLRAFRKGYKILYHPNLIVYHKIQNRLNREFLLTYSYNIGITESQIDFTHNKPIAAVKFSKYLADLALSQLKIKQSDNFEYQLVNEHLKGYVNFMLNKLLSSKKAYVQARQIHT